MLIVLLWLLLTNGCSQLFRVTGVVLDGNGVPLVDAIVSVYDPEESWKPHGKKVSAEGKFEVLFSARAFVKRFLLETHCEGYESDKRIVTQNHDTDIRVILCKKPASVSP